MTGFYNPSKERLKSIRNKIKADSETFQELIFFQGILRINMEALEEMPISEYRPEYMEAFEKEPLIANKQFYYVKEFKSDVLLSDELLPLADNRSLPLLPNH
jgi:hypothetical protein